MKLYGGKLLAAIQIVLQLCPSSFLLYLAPTGNVSAQELVRADESSQKQTENSVAKATIQAGTLLSNDNAGELS